MANNYTLQFIVPDTATFDTERTYLDFWQLSGGIGGYGGIDTGFLTLAELYFDALCTTFSGEYTITSVQDGENTIYTVALTLNQDLDVLGEYVTVAFFSDEGATIAGFQIASTESEATPCDVCYSIQRPGCQTSYTLELDLTPATTYTVAFYSNNGNVYTQQVEAGGDGELVIDASAPEFPEGFFIPESGGYTVKIFTDTDLVDVVPFTVGANQYQCIQLSFQYVVTTTSSIQANFDYLIHDDDSDTNYFIIDDIGNNFIV